MVAYSGSLLLLKVQLVSDNTGNLHNPGFEVCQYKAVSVCISAHVLHDFKNFQKARRARDIVPFLAVLFGYPWLPEWLLGFNKYVF